VVDVVRMRSSGWERWLGGLAAFAGWAALVVGGPVSGQDQPGVARPVAEQDPPAAAGDSSSGNRTIRPGDSIQVSVLNESSISGTFRVGGDGRINYPLLGRLEVASASLEEVARQIEKRLEQDYIRDAVVSANLSSRQQNSVFVYGAVRNQGGVTFDPQDGLTLGKAIARVGGTQESADTSEVEIQRADGNDLDSDKVNLDRSQEYELEDGDIVVVPAKPEIVASEVMRQVEAEEEPMGRVVVSGEVKREGIVDVPLEEGADILEVIVRSGGFSRLARPSKVKVRRERPDGTHESITVDVEEIQKAGGGEGFQVRAGDTIFVPESIF